jgi:hypothetical protein
MISRRDFLSKVAVLTGSVAFGVATRKSDEDWLIRGKDAAEIGVNFDKLNEYCDPPLSVCWVCNLPRGEVEFDYRTHGRFLRTVDASASALPY